MLEGNLFNFVSFERTENACEGIVKLHPESEIYSAHFKGMPITPGVCLVQMASEIMEKALGAEACLAEAKDIRFLKPVIPTEVQELKYEMEFYHEEEQRIICKASVTAGESLYAKMNMTYRMNHE